MRRRFVFGPFAIRSFQFVRRKRNGLLAGMELKALVQNLASRQTDDGGSQIASNSSDLVERW